MLGCAFSSSQDEDVLLSKYGVLVHKSRTVVIVKNDGLIITFNYDPGELAAYWNEFVEKSEHMLQYIGNNNNFINFVRKNMKIYTDTISRSSVRSSVR